MHGETSHAQSLMPRLPQRLVRRYAIQLVQVQAAADQRANDTTNRAADGAADCRGASQAGLWWQTTAIVGLKRSWLGTWARRRRWRRRLIWIGSV
jgi:hypothetical protein